MHGRPSRISRAGRASQPNRSASKERMADATVELVWEGTGLVFRGGAPGGPEVVVDGNGKAGISPVQNLLLALAGCMAADIVDTLGKGRVSFTGVRVRLEGDRVEQPPRRYRGIRMRVETTGLATESRDKLQRAIELSREKYCSVLHSLRSDI